MSAESFGAREHLRPGERQTRQFTSREQDQLKDVLILMMLKTFDSPMDADIHAKLMRGDALDESELSHMLSETRRITTVDFQALVGKLEKMQPS